jgi:AbrB family looped-hinge helix DNA binding protein
MLTTIDAAGRIVVPKPMREALGITDRTELDVTVDDGRIVISPVPVAKRVEQTPDGAVIVGDDVVPPLTADAVRHVLESIRT